MDIEKIESLRLKRNLSQSELAKKIGISQVGYSNAIKRGDLKVSVLEKIAKYFDVPIETFFSERERSYKKEINALKAEVSNLREYIATFELAFKEKIVFSGALLQVIMELYTDESKIKRINKKTIREIQEGLKGIKEYYYNKELLHPPKKSYNISRHESELFDELLKG